MARSHGGERIELGDWERHLELANETGISEPEFWAMSPAQFFRRLSGIAIREMARRRHIEHCVAWQTARLTLAAGTLKHPPSLGSMYRDFSSELSGEEVERDTSDLDEVLAESNARVRARDGS